MFIAARISYIRFFTAVHIYDFHISTIIILITNLQENVTARGENLQSDLGSSRVEEFYAQHYQPNKNVRGLLGLRDNFKETR